MAGRIITRHGKPAGILIGFESEDDWFDYHLENDRRFLHRVEAARQSLRVGQGVRFEDLADDCGLGPCSVRKRMIATLRIRGRPGDAPGRLVSCLTSRGATLYSCLGKNS